VEAVLVAMNRRRFAIKRLLQAVPVLFGLSVLIFSITRIIPSSPVRLALGRGASQEQVDQAREALGFNDPLHIQYVDWLTGIFSGDWGVSLMTRNNVFNDISNRLAATVELVVVALLFAIVLAIPLGVVAGARKDQWPDHFSRVLAFLGVSMPGFWLAILLQILFFGILGLFPLTGRLSSGVAPPPSITGLYLVDSLLSGQISKFFDALHHITLPAVALGTATLGRLGRYIRSDMIEEGNKDYVKANRAYGMPENLIKYKYMLKNAFSSALTIIGLTFGSMIGNAFLIEIIFAWPGMARYGVNAILFTDFNAIIGVTMVVGMFYIFSNLVVDLLYGYLDPRIMRGE